MNKLTADMKVISGVAESNPFIENYNGQVFCFYCKHDEPSHKDDCIYIKAQAIMRYVKVTEPAHG